MVREIEEILKHLGWGDGFRIPVSNEENKKLENLIEAKVKEKARLVADTEEMDERLNALNRHLKNVNHDEIENQKLLAAARRQLENAEHLHTLVRSEYESLQRERRVMKHSLEEITEKNKKAEQELKQSAGKVAKLKNLMRWDSEELLAWEDLHSRKDEDLSLLQHFIDEDTDLFKELEMKRQALQTEVDKQRIVADEAATQVTVLEHVLDRVAQLYRQAHSDHQDLIRQWENSVRAMHLKDKDINDTLNEILTVRAQGRVKMDELLEAKELDANVRSNNAETQALADETHRQLNVLRSADQILLKDLHSLENEVGVMKRTLSGTGVKLNDQKSQNSKAKKEVTERDKKVQALKRDCEKLDLKLDDVEKNVWDAGQRSRHMEEAVKEEEHLKECYIRDISRLQSFYFRVAQELKAVRDHEQLQNIELCNIEKKKAGLNKCMEKLDKELFKLKNMEYELEFSEQKLRSRIAYVMGDSKTAQHEENKKKIEQLETVLQEKQSMLTLLTAQAQRLENDCRQLSNMLSVTSEEVEKLQWKRQDWSLQVEGGKKQLKVARSSYNDRLVEHALLRVRVDQIQRALKREGSVVLSLSKNRMELESMMKERQIEINLRKEIMITKRKTLIEERSQLTLALQQLKSKLEQLQNRFDIVINVMGKDEFGELVSPAMLKLKVAQEKMMLEQEGDILDAKIQKAEKEIEAMENTLKVVNTSNETYRQSLTMVDKDGPEGEELRTLEKAYYQAMVSLRSHREQLAIMEAEVKELSNKLSELEEKEEEAKAVLKDHEVEAASLSKELQDQDLKLHRAESQLKRLVRDLRSKSDSTVFAMEEKDIALRELTDQNQSALEQLAEISTRFMETAPVITQYLKEKNLNLPQPGQHLRGMPSSSSLSGASSARSVRSNSTSVSSCTGARRRIFDPAPQGIRSYHGTVQFPSQLVFPLEKRESCCAPHSIVTIGSMSDTHTQGDSGTSAACFDTHATLKIPSDVGSCHESGVVELPSAHSGATVTASTELSQTSENASSCTRRSNVSDSKKIGGEKKTSLQETHASILQSMVTVESVHPSMSDTTRHTSYQKSQTFGQESGKAVGSGASSQGSSRASSQMTRRMSCKTGRVKAKKESNGAGQPDKDDQESIASTSSKEDKVEEK